MTGKQQRHHLIADLAIREPAAVFILGVQQQAEDVAAPPSGRAAPRDLAVDDHVELARRLLHPRPRREGGAQDAQ